jgi:putative glutamine amidotransferase
MLHGGGMEIIMKRPIIGVTTTIEDSRWFTINNTYLDAIYKAGGLAVILPYTTEEEKFEEYADTFDGFLFTGGVDIDPKYYGEEKDPKVEEICPERDAFEEQLFGKCYPTNKPILGICRGEQVINVFLGGTLHQHIDGHVQKEHREVRTHGVNLVEGGYLHQLLNKDKLMVNSFHHQCVKQLADGLVADAYNEEGYLEAFYAKEHPFCVCVQWHPESYHRLDETSSKIFDAFIDACKK